MGVSERSFGLQHLSSKRNVGRRKRRRAEKNRSSHGAVLKEEGPKGLLKRKRKLQREGKVSWGQYRHRTDPPHQTPSEMTHESSSDDGSVETVLRVMEGLRGDAFQKAKDFGIAALSAPGGLRTLIAEIRGHGVPPWHPRGTSFVQEWTSSPWSAESTGGRIHSVLHWETTKVVDPYDAARPEDFAFGQLEGRVIAGVEWFDARSTTHD